jgi:hypothetical protein
MRLDRWGRVSLCTLAPHARPDPTRAPRAGGERVGECARPVGRASARRGSRADEAVRQAREAVGGGVSRCGSIDGCGSHRALWRRTRGRLVRSRGRTPRPQCARCVYLQTRAPVTRRARGGAAPRPRLTRIDKPSQNFDHRAHLHVAPRARPPARDARRAARCLLVHVVGILGSASAGSARGRTASRPTVFSLLPLSPHPSSPRIGSTHATTALLSGRSGATTQRACCAYIGAHTDAQRGLGCVAVRGGGGGGGWDEDCGEVGVWGGMVAESSAAAHAGARGDCTRVL